MAIQTIPIDQIVIPEVRSNAVYNHEQYESLKQSIASSGIQFRPVVRQLPQFKYELVDGRHRLQCWKELGHTDIEVDVEVLTDEQAAIKHITANHHRGESDPIGLSKVIRKLRDAGKTYEDIGNMIGYSAGTVSGYEKLAGLPEEFQQALTDGRLKIAHIKEVSKLSEASDIAAGLAYAIQFSWPATTLRYWVETRVNELAAAQNQGFTPQTGYVAPPPPPPEAAQYRQCLCCGAHSVAQEMTYWAICKGCHDALEYLKSVNPQPWDAIQAIAAAQAEYEKVIAEKDAQLKELSQKFIDLSLRLAPMMQNTQPQPQPQPQPATPGAQIPGIQSWALPRKP